MTKVATEEGPDTHEDNGGKKDKPNRAQTIAMCLQLWFGLGLIAVLFLGWLGGTSIAALGLAVTFILIDVASNRRRSHDGQ
jgi:hypothetical protein